MISIIQKTLVTDSIRGETGEPKDNKVFSSYNHHHPPRPSQNYVWEIQDTGGQIRMKENGIF